MGEVVNLRQARKAKRRAEGESLAAANRLKHGRRKEDVQLAEMARKRRDGVLAGARRERPED